MTRTDGPVVIYIAGSGRSGSTLLERILGAIPGFTNVGELVDLPRRVYPEDERCGCGEVFSRCEFWQRAGTLAFGGWSADQVARLQTLQRGVARQRYIPAHLSPVKSKAFVDDVQEYRRTYARLYEAVATVAGAEVVVDASKWPAQALALAGGGIDLRVIHLHRDVHGVAWSMNKRGLSRPQASRSEDLMFSQGTVPAALRWTVCQTEVDLALSTVPKALVSYEELLLDPPTQVRSMLEALGLDVDDGMLGHVGSDEVLLGPSHGLSGNPSRFAQGRVHLRTDDSWRIQMPRAQQHVLTAIAAPAKFRMKRAKQPSIRHSVDGSRRTGEREA